MFWLQSVQALNMDAFGLISADPSEEFCFQSHMLPISISSLIVFIFLHSYCERYIGQLARFWRCIRENAWNRMLIGIGYCTGKFENGGLAELPELPNFFLKCFFEQCSQYNLHFYLCFDRDASFGSHRNGAKWTAGTKGVSSRESVFSNEMLYFRLISKMVL